MNKRDRILIRSVNWLGDAVMSIPAIKAIRKASPGAEISILARPSVAALYEKSPLTDHVILYGEEYAGFAGKLRLSRILRKNRFGRAFLLQNAFDAALLTALAGVPDRTGYNRDGRGFLLTKSVPFHNEDRKIHHIDYYLHLLAQAGVPVGPGESAGWKGGGRTMGALFPWVSLSLEERLAARETLSCLHGPVLGINPGAAFGSAKRWLPERFADVAAWFLKDTGGGVVIFGGKNEAHMAAEIETRVEREIPWLRERGGLLNMAGRTSLRELIALIAECQILLSNDSGPMHISYAVGTPVVAIFGSTSPELTGPVGEGDRVIRAEARCSPCFSRTCKENDLVCMYGILSEDVYFAIKDLLPRKKAVFFDRDGTLCRDAHYLNSWDNLEVYPEITALNALKEKGYALVGVSNQSGIARGLVDESFTREVNNLFMEKYGFDDFLYCPHHPDEHCACRKPEPGMLVRARVRQGVDLKESFVVGDKDDDMLLAKMAGARGVLVKTGKQQHSPYADFIVRDLKEAVTLIIKAGEEG